MDATSTFSIRRAKPGDLDSLVALDPLAQPDSQHRACILRALDSKACIVILTEDRLIGYGALEYSFYGLGFVSMLYIHPDFRRRGAGSMLMKHFESNCRTAKLFTSTNLSNLPMQSLLTQLGFTPSGVIHNLDEDDPELVYCKFLR